MRIIAGRLRSRSLQAPSGLDTRPTSDRLRETLFNVLAPRIEGAGFLDLYAGSGAVGIEAVSRGAARVVFVERAAAPLRVLRANLARLALSDGVDVRAEKVSTFLRRDIGLYAGGFDLVFLDPPYDAAREYETALGMLGGADPGSEDPDPEQTPLLNTGAMVIAEHRRKEKLNDEYGALTRTRLLEQGDAALSFYAMRTDGTRQAKGNR